MHLSPQFPCPGGLGMPQVCFSPFQAPIRASAKFFLIRNSGSCPCSPVVGKIQFFEMIGLRSFVSLLDVTWGHSQLLLVIAVLCHVTLSQASFTRQVVPPKSVRRLSLQSANMKSVNTLMQPHPVTFALLSSLMKRVATPPSSQMPPTFKGRMLYKMYVLGSRDLGGHPRIVPTTVFG